MEEIKTGTPTAKKNSEPPKDNNLVKPLAPAKPNFPAPKFSKPLIAIFVLVCLVGIASGYALYAKQTAGTVRLAGKDVQVISTPTEEGVKDASTFKDTTTGTLQVNDGKITTEGSFVLIRGDVSQNVYLTSSVIDMSKYVGKKVQIWGETFQGQSAGWLMDVGRIKLLQ